MSYPTCECGRELCDIDRTFDDCQECGRPIDAELKLDFDLQPLEPR
jgi:hypothetical protein